MALTNEEIKAIIKEIFEEHEKNITSTKIVRGVITKIYNRIENIETKVKENKTDIDDLKNSISFTQDLLGEKILKFETEVKTNLSKVNDNLSEINDEQKSHITKLKNEIRKMEDKCRRNNLRIDGIHESLNETWNECEQKI